MISDTRIHSKNIRRLITVGLLQTLFFSSIELFAQDSHGQTRIKRGNLTFQFAAIGTDIPVTNVRVSIYRGDTLLITHPSDTFSELSFHTVPGVYNIVIEKVGYRTKRIDTFTVRQSAMGLYKVNMIKETIRDGILFTEKSE